eukprot:6363507-Amphidinium_carterae.1
MQGPHVRRARQRTEVRLTQSVPKNEVGLDLKRFKLVLIEFLHEMKQRKVLLPFRKPLNQRLCSQHKKEVMRVSQIAPQLKGS